jgi:hypothetical protein
MGRGIWTMDNRLVPTTLAPAFLAYFLPPPTNYRNLLENTGAWIVVPIH